MVLLDSIDREPIEGKALSTAKTSKYSNTTYCTIYLNGKNVYLHRYVLARMLGRELTNKDRVDHINGNGLDNRRENIRLCKHQQNMWNQPSRRNTSSKYKGVTYFKRDGNWQAKIAPNGKTLQLGYFKTEVEAADAYNQKATELFGEFAKLNDL